MSKLQDLIDSLCPNGVEFKPLGEVCEFKRGDTLSSKDAIVGTVPVMAGGQKPSCYHNVANRSGETIVIAGSGAYAGFVTYWNIPVFVSDAFSVNPSNCLLPKYVFYFLKNNQEKIHATKKGAGVPHVHGKDIAKFSIPIPPLAVQEEIVRILDRFSNYAAELQAELQARKEQYEYYRNLLLTFNPSACGCGTDDKQKDNVIAPPSTTYKIQWKKMGEIGSFIRGKRFVRTDIVECGVPCIHYGDMYTYYGLYATKTRGYINQKIAEKMRFAEKNDIVIVAAGENKDDLGNALAWLGEEPAAVHDACFIFKSKMHPNYLSHVCRTKSYHNQVRMFANEAKICSVSGTDLAKVVIPLPPYELQEKIASILDRFEALVNDIRKGLPVEIEAVKTRYEYYRNKLLTFKPLPA